MAGSARRVVLTSGAARERRARFHELEAAGFDVHERFDLLRSPGEEDLARALDTAWAVVAGGEPYSQKVLAALPDLRVIARTGVGYDAIDVSAASARGVLVVVTPGALAESVADFTLALMLGALRQLVALDAATRAGSWRVPRLGRDLAGRTVGIVGLGAIGRAVARRLAGFACRVLAADPFIDPATAAALGVSLVPLDTLVREAEIVTLHLPLAPSTRHIIGRRELSLLRREALLVNTSRGAVVDEDALLVALAEGRLAGAALDVFAREPLRAGHPLTTLPNVLLSPHAAWATEEATEKMCDATVRALLDVAGGRVPDGCLNPEALAAARA